MAELTQREKQLLAKMKADRKEAEEEQRLLSESDRVQPMPKDKTDFPIGIIPDADTSA